MRVPENVVKVYRGLIQVNENTKMVRNNYYEGVCFALKNAARMVTMTEQEDIGVITSANALELAFDTSSDVDIYFTISMWVDLDSLKRFMIIWKILSKMP